MIIIIAIIIFFIVFSYNLTVNSVFIDYIYNKSNLLSTTAINKSISNIIKSNKIYFDLVNVVFDDDKNIKLIQSKPYEINKLSNEISIETENQIKSFGENGIQIPLGTLLGVSLFTGLGPNINLKVEPIGAVACNFLSKFDSAGINQTIHKLYAVVECRVGVVMPFYNENISNSQKVLICENVILGQVPEVYLYSDNLDTLLNLVPI